MADARCPDAGRAAPVAAIALILLIAAPATARAGVTLSVDSSGLGKIRLAAAASPPASDLRVVELVDGAEVPVPAQASDAGVEAVANWTCARRDRTFRAVGGGEVSADQTATTPSCAGRVHVRTRHSVPAGSNIRVSIRDRWLIGDVRARLCVRPASGSYACKLAVIPPGQIETSRVHPTSIVGDWTIRLAVHGRSITRRVSVTAAPGGPRRAEPALLATGDSMMINPMRVLRARLSGRAVVVPDIYVSSAVTKPYVVNWATLPRKQLRAERPDAVVIALGIGDGGPLQAPAGTVHCCGSDWIAAYASRARRVMQAYTRGRAAVVWLNVPYVSDAARSQTITAVNAGLASAAAGLQRVRMIDVAGLLTPGGVYRQWLERRRRTIKIRRDDGIHMTAAGAAIVDRVVTRELARLGIL